MMSCFPKNKGYYISLFLVLIVGIVLALSASYDKSLQFFIIVMITVFYVLFGILHHHLHHDNSPKVVVEYVLVGSLGMALVLLVLKGGFI